MTSRPPRATALANTWARGPRAENALRPSDGAATGPSLPLHTTANTSAQPGAPSSASPSVLVNLDQSLASQGRDALEELMEGSRPPGFTLGGQSFANRGMGQEPTPGGSDSDEEDVELAIRAAADGATVRDAGDEEEQVRAPTFFFMLLLT